MKISNAHHCLKSRICRLCQLINKLIKAKRLGTCTFQVTKHFVSCAIIMHKSHPFVPIAEYSDMLTVSE